MGGKDNCNIIKNFVDRGGIKGYDGIKSGEERNLYENIMYFGYSY